MPRLVIDLPGAPSRFPPPNAAHPTAYLVAEDGQFYRFRWAPLETEASGIAAAWAELDRPGRTPLLSKAGRPLRTLAFSIFVAELDGGHVEPELAGLARMARHGLRVRLELGDHGGDPDVPEWSVITSMTRRAVARQHGTNRITQATLDLELTEAVDVDDVTLGVGPVGGGADFTGRVATYRARYTGGRARTYRVVAGDTLHSISLDFYGSPAWWRNIADANGVRDPRHLRPGRLLRIP